MTTANLTGLSYRIDANDRLVEFSGAWDEFALANGAPELRAEAFLGRALFDYLAGAEVIQIYRVMLANVRATRIPAVFPFRCDSPAVRRYLRMSVLPFDGASIIFETSILREEPRESVALLERSHPRRSDFLVMCSWCKKMLADDAWVEVEEGLARLGVFTTVPMPEVSHGICPACLAAANITPRGY